MTRKPGNPGWSAGRPAAVPTSAPTEFELEVERLGLRQEDYAFSERLRRWVVFPAAKRKLSSALQSEIANEMASRRKLSS